jgi:putative SOS response-associated peptidase YedK
MPRLGMHFYPKRKAKIIIEEDGTRSLVEMGWGITRFIEDGKTKPVTNARTDKFQSRTWKSCVTARRCLIPASGYFEPGLGPVGARGEVLFTVKGRSRFFIAGLWDTEQGELAERTFTMVTTEPNAFVARFHDRMPVVLDDDGALAWIGDKPLADERLAALCGGLPAEALLHDEIAAKPKSDTLPPKLKVTRPSKKAAADEGPLLL